ncbi:MAG: hypothetical protein ACRC7S_02370 [Cetobacterium sp.]
MGFETQCMSFPCTELLLFNYAEVNSNSDSRAPLIIYFSIFLNILKYFLR